MDVIQECMNMIANGGEAKSLAMQAISQARVGKFKEAEESLKLSDKALIKSHQAHTTLLFHDAEHQDLKVSILMVHAADHLSSAETVRILAEDMIELYREVKNV